MISIESRTSYFNASKLAITGAFVAFVRSFLVQATFDSGSKGMGVFSNMSGYVICSVETGKKDKVGGSV